MNNALHLTLATFDTNSGVVKKINAQARAIKKCGFDRVFVGIIDEDLIFNIDGNKIGKIQSVSNLKGQKEFFIKIENFIKQNDINFIYYRFNAASEPSVIRFFQNLRKLNVRCVMEIPTYPYDGEVKFKNRLTYLDILTRRLLAKQFDYIVTFSDCKKIFGKKTINISNGIDFSQIPLLKPVPHDDFIMLGVANLRYWHGFDRILKGLYEFKSKNGEKPNVKFLIVSGKENDELLELKNMVAELDLNDCVSFKGEVSGIELDKLFNESDLAIGSLGRHRNGINTLKTLKNVEYAARGVPFIYSENNPDFDDKPYILKVSQDDSPIDIRLLVEFSKSVKMTPEEIRNTVLNLSWEHQIKKVVECEYESCQQN